MTFLILPLAAYALNPNTPANGYAIRGWQSESGLPANRVRVMLQTPDGYLWIGTDLGLARFDGLGFDSFGEQKNVPSRRNTVFGLAQDKDGAIWAGTSDGLYTYRAGQFSRLSTKSGLVTNSIRTLVALPDGTIVAAGTLGINYIRGGKIEAPPELQRQLTGNVRAFAIRPNGSVYIGGETGLCRVTGAEVETLSGTEPFPGKTYPCFLSAPDGRFWIGSSVGLHCIEPDGSVRLYGSKQGLTNLRVQCLEMDRDGNLWVGTTGGLFRFRNDRLEPALYPDGFGVGTILALCEDKDGSLWVGSSIGLYRLRDVPVTTIGASKGLNQTAVRSVVAARDGTWLIGTWGAGLYRYDGREAKLDPIVKAAGIDQVGSLAEDTDGALWIGAWSGLYRLANGVVTDFTVRGAAETKEARRVRTPLAGVAHSRINAITPARDGGIWVATRGGVYRGRDGIFTLVTERANLPDGDFLCLIEAHDGRLWTVTGTSAAWLNGDKWTPADGLPAIHPRSLCEDASDTLWVATDGEGVFRLKDGRWRNYTTAHGLIDDHLVSITEQDGLILMGTMRGLMSIAVDDFDAVDAQRSGVLHVRAYTKADGMPVSECNGEGWPNLEKTADGRLLVPTGLGVAVVDPRRPLAIEPPPPVTIDAVVSGDTRFTPGAAISLPPGHAGVRFLYSTVKLTSPENVRYRVKLSPLDESWHGAADRREIRYPRLQPGSYVFSVSARNSYGLWSEPGASIAFIVRPFFFQTVWFRLGMLLTGGALAFGGYWWWLRRLRRHAEVLHRQNAELENRVAERTAELARSYDSLRATQRDLIESSRRAGVAEMAAGVLHNIGNALNSVNTSAGVAAVRARQIKVSGISRIATMLADQRERLAEFFGTDSRARQIPDYLLQFSSYLQVEQEELVRELEQLTEEIEKINRLVAAQESHTRVARVIENVAPAEIVEFAYQVNEAALAQAEIHVTRTIEAAPLVAVDRHKIVQILSCLLRNAAASCNAAAPASKRIMLGVGRTPDAKVVIRVADNGIGLAPEELTRVFAFGSTEGNLPYRSGLHDSAVAVQDLGGTLTAESDGPGRGATFTIQLPASTAGVA